MTMQTGDRVFVRQVEGRDGKKHAVDRHGTLLHHGTRRAWWVQLDARAQDGAAHEYAEDDTHGRGRNVEVGLEDATELAKPAAAAATTVEQLQVEVAKLRSELDELRQYVNDHAGRRK
jgi:hypothetical protein